MTDIMYRCRDSAQVLTAFPEAVKPEVLKLLAGLWEYFAGKLMEGRYGE